MSGHDQTNVAPGPAGTAIVTVDMERQLALFDTLPEAIRDIIREAPALVNVEEFALAWQQFGPAAPAMIISCLEDLFPGWHMPPRNEKHGRRRRHG